MLLMHDFMFFLLNTFRLLARSTFTRLLKFVGIDLKFSILSSSEQQLQEIIKKFFLLVAASTAALLH
jgi:hypothetical protein